MTRSLVIIFALLAAIATRGAGAQHWSFVRPVAAPIPAVRQPAWLRNPVDAFVMARMEAHGLRPSAPANRRTLYRRLAFDLTGLPPAPIEMARFLQDKTPDAYERAVDRLLASKQFGERWAQHWLDVVRFAESNGYEHDLDRPQAWRYRDWVVNALNSDKPYDQFLREQVAGDLMSAAGPDGLIATGFLRTGPFHITGGNLDPTEMRQEWLTEAVAGIGNSILGVTIGCARCHDHKFDPIKQTDYYRLQAYFAAAANRDEVRATEAEKRGYAEAEQAIKERIKPIDEQIAAIERPYRDRIREQKRQLLAPEYRAALDVEASKRTPQQRRLAGEAGTQLSISWDEVVNALTPADRARRAALRASEFAMESRLPPALPEAQGVADIAGIPQPTHLLVRGDVHTPGEVVTPGVPACMMPSTVSPAGGTGENPRMALARWLSAPENPLTARVMVNRIWQHLFGRGLVATPNDFGKNGQPPSHPELLDWLAVKFARPAAAQTASEAGCGWSVKSMIRLLVTSSTYRQACEFDAAKSAIDPDNRLLWRAARKRLDAEALRDAILAASGTLNLETGGPSIRVPLEPEVYETIFTESEPDNLWPATADARQHTRRSLYLFRKRNVRLPMMALFDQPDMMSSCGARAQSVHALQSLTLINSKFMREQSLLVARRLVSTVSGPGESARQRRVESLFELALNRPARPDELKATMVFLKGQTALLRGRIARHETVIAAADVPAGSDAAEFAALADLCLATLNRNDFLTVR